MFEGLRRRFRPWFVIWIIIMWCLLMGEVTWANAAGGLLVGLFVVLALPLPAMPIAGMRVSWLGLIRYLFIWSGELMVASFKVAWLALRPAAPPRTAILQVPMRVSNDLVLTLATTFYNLQPGGSVSDIDIANRMWTIHVLDAETDEDIAREIENVAALERRMITIFEKG
ncbi:Na+/H+ antiporter subunit E [Corynebacterium halotolerans]|uniref:Putative monovalent cation/H+ antiporter subunit E n=1 Tax=Corynebacterium halotolerans YIM 70093 = DSM 44683 TaxID=1121362 RepID=M1NVI6_9CORY|nr:Na+/H+ antiporter subunit E [Corynebacterium halotolerans]AGF73477.1 putative monovalent cation/H+ antiporter subunit E [Corynebacterium halotolerans YIM 70093 = DSM 44683]